MLIYHLDNLFGGSVWFKSFAFFFFFLMDWLSLSIDSKKLKKNTFWGHLGGLTG